MPNSGQNRGFFIVSYDLEIWQMTFYTTSSFVHHFETIGEFNLELQLVQKRLI